MKRAVAFGYGLVVYAIFLGAFLYAIGFVGDMVVPKTIDNGDLTLVPAAIVINLMLLSIFALQHSVMARKQFTEWWTQYIPRSVERSTYVLFAGLALILLLWQWRPIPAVLWQIKDPQLAANGIVVPLEGAGKVTSTISSPIQVHGVEKVPARRGPTLGEHNEEILHELGGHVCRCTGYVGIKAAVREAWPKLR